MKLRTFIIVAAVLAIVPAAYAQDCMQCDPYSSSCDQYCTECITWSIDQGCLEWFETTCGEHGSPCLTCNPTWTETDRTTVGTYGQSHWNFWDGFSCDHHRVDRVTQTDTSHCNTDSSYWTRQFCDDWEDGSKYAGGSYVDCCDGFCVPGVPCSLFTCNDWHSCF
jgi:hypothetical protein